MGMDRLEQLLKLVEVVGETKQATAQYPIEVGKAYFFRTVTYHMLGRVKSTTGSFVLLENAVYVADSGRFGEAIKGDIELNELEHLGQDWTVNMDSVSDFGEWKHDIPSSSR